MARESKRLQAQVLVMASGLDQQLTGLRAALESVRQDVQLAEVPLSGERLVRRLDVLAAALPVARSLWVLDAGARVTAAGGMGVPREDHSQADWFRKARERHDARSLILGSPHVLSDGNRTLELALALSNGDGGFAGAVVASLDTDHLEKVLRAQVFAPDIMAGIRHAEGSPLSVVSADVGRPKVDAAGQAFRRHLESGRATSVLRGAAPSGAGERLTALHNLQPAALVLDRPLVLGVSRSVTAVQAPWRQQTLMVAAIWFASALTAAGALWMGQRRRQEREDLLEAQLARQAKDAERLRLALHGGDLALWDLDVPADRATVNERWGQMLGYRPGEPEADGNQWHALVHPEDLPAVLDLQQAHLDGRSDHFEATYRLRHRDGGWIWVLDRGRVVERDANGRPLRMVGTHLDITERKRIEAQAQEARDALAATLDALPDLLFDIDLEGRVHDFHSPRRELLYASPQDFLGRRLAEFLPIDVAELIMAAVLEAHEQGHSGGREYALALASGVHWFELSVARRTVPPGQLPRCIVMARDITERKQGEVQRAGLERNLREAQKMESIGTLAGGIAHDFNNILPAILGNVELARCDLPPDHPALQSLEQIQRAALRARSLVQQILTFGRRASPDPVPQPLQGVLDETMALLRMTLPASVKLETRIADDLGPAAIDGTQWQQILMNLCTNAWHALPAGKGRIEIGLAWADPQGVAAWAGQDALSGPCIHLWVRDDGCGMDEATRARIFDPFFTTKPVGQGTGLGLSVVHGIVQGLRGRIAVESQPGQGSCFHVLLPVAADRCHEGSRLEEPPSMEAPARQGQRIWYVDDDPVMLLMVQRLLSREGHEVVAWDSATKALAGAEGADRPPALIVTDYNMPDLSGLDLAQQLLARWPGLPIVLTTGYGVDELRARALGVGVRALMGKENTLDELVGLIQQLLAAGEESRLS